MQTIMVEQIETIIVDLPLKRPQHFAPMAATSTAIVLVRIRSTEGLEGIGECVTPSGPWWAGESVESIKLMIDQYISPVLVGNSIHNLRGIFRKIDSKVYGNPFAKAGVEMALLDLQGKHAQRPVHDLLGGRQRDGLRCSWPLASGDIGREIEEAENLLDERKFNCFKLKMGFLEPQADVERICAIAKTLEGRAEVRGDPNERWDEATCKWAFPRMLDAGVTMIEQPLARWNFEGSARVTQSTPMAVMADESVMTLQDTLRLGEHHAADLVSIKVMKHGGLVNARRIADVAMASGVSIYMGTFLECSVGTAANMQLAATLEELPFGGELSGANLVAEDITTKPARYQDFELKLEDGVGHAIELDEDKVKALRRDRCYSSISVAAASL